MRSELRRVRVWGWLICTLSLAAAADAPNIKQETVAVPMRDGVQLSTDIYRDPSLGKAPVLLVRTPYGKESSRATAEKYAAAGYVAVVQSTRGRPPSEGAFVPYNNEGQDGYDTIEWLGKQPWSNGRAGTWGGSYVGAVQWQAAVERPPGLAVIAPTYTWNNFYRNLYLGGAVRLSLLAGWAAAMTPPPGVKGPQRGEWNQKLLHLPLSEMDTQIGWPIPWLNAMLTHPSPDGYWYRLNLTDRIVELDLPAQHMVGYYDFFSREAVAGFVHMQQRAHNLGTRRQQQLILGPWDHGPTRSKVGDVDFGPEAEIDSVGENLQWFDRFLKPTPQNTGKFAPVRYFVMGANAWKESETWPPAGHRSTPFYLHSKGRANSLKGNGRLERAPPEKNQPADTFVADPANPAPANPATPDRPIGAAIWGPVDQRKIEERNDVLVYTSEPLSAPLAFAGNVSAELAVSADTPDADWVVKLIDVHPDGFAQNLVVGILRGSFRESEMKPSPLIPNQVYAVKVDLGPVAAQLKPGHRLRVDVSGAYFPLFDRNPNTGEGPFGRTARTANSKVYHDKQFVSRVLLPVSVE